MTVVVYERRSLRLHMCLNAKAVYSFWKDGTKAEIKYYLLCYKYTNNETWFWHSCMLSVRPCSVHSSFCLSHYLHLSLSSLPRTLIWKEGAPLPTQYVLFVPAALSCSTPPLAPALLGKTQGTHAFFFYSPLLFPIDSQTPEKKHSETSRGRKRKADTYSESSQGMTDTGKKSI